MGDSNQDIHAYYNVINWPKNVHILNHAVHQFEFDQVVISGISWHESISPESLDTIPLHPSKLNIFLANIEDKEDSFATVKSTLANQYDAVLLGTGSDTMTEGVISWCGGLLPLPADEAVKHGCVDLLISAKSNTFTVQEVSTMHYVRATVEVQPTMDQHQILTEVEQAVKAFNSDDILELILTGQHNKMAKPSSEDIEDRIKKFIEYYFVHDLSVSEYDIESMKNDNKHNIIGLFIDHVNHLDVPKTTARDLLVEGLDLFMNEKVMK